MESKLTHAIESGEWEAASGIFQSHPELCQKRHSRHGWTKLHWLCSIGATPASLIELVASLYPTAISMIDTYLGDTCLHLVCRNAQFSGYKLRILLRYCDPAALLVRNRMGGTALHSSVYHNAALDALKLLVEKNPQVVLVRTHENISVISTLWSAFLQTIPGHMHVCKILKKGVEEAGESKMFDRFWRKMEYLGLLFYKFKQAENSVPGSSVPSTFCTKDHLLHGLLLANAPLKLFLLCLKLNPSFASTVDQNGNTPLHILVETRPYRMSEREAILHSCRLAASIRNKQGDLPLHIALRNRIPYENGVDLLVAPVDQRDRRTGLFPCLIAAENGGRVAVNTTFQLLVERPGDLMCSKNTN